MATLSFERFHSFVPQLVAGTHDLNAHTFRLFLSNVDPVVATMTAAADLTAITNPPFTAPVDISNTQATNAGVVTCNCAASKSWSNTATAPIVFRAVAIYNDNIATPADPLICAWDEGSASAVSLTAGQTYKVTFQNSKLFTVGA